MRIKMEKADIWEAGCGCEDCPIVQMLYRVWGGKGVAPFAVMVEGDGVVTITPLDLPQDLLWHGSGANLCRLGEMEIDFIRRWDGTHDPEIWPAEPAERRNLYPIEVRMSAEMFMR